MLKHQVAVVVQNRDGAWITLRPGVQNGGAIRLVRGNASLLSRKRDIHLIEIEGILLTGPLARL
jgi:hypothetical protein